MAKELTASIFVAAATAAVVAIGFAFPPIISRGGEEPVSDTFKAAAIEENTFCRQNLSDVDCNCFAGKAAHVLSQDKPEVYGFTYADRSDLARGQASAKC